MQPVDKTENSLIRSSDIYKTLKEQSADVWEWSQES